MQGKEVGITAVALVAIAAVGVLAYRHVTRPPAGLCQICQRTLHHGVNFRLELASGRTEEVCCPRCGMHYALHHPRDISRAWATDFPSAKSIPAESAYYVEGGDVEYCTLHEPAVQREPQAVAVRDYDRCLPTLVAFSTRQEAEAYRQQHGGRVLTYEQSLESVRTQ